MLVPLAGERILRDSGGDDAAVRPGFRTRAQPVPAQDVVAHVASGPLGMGPEDIRVPGRLNIDGHPVVAGFARQLRRRVPEAAHLSLLWTLDIAIWMHGMNGAEPT